MGTSPPGGAEACKPTPGVGGWAGTAQGAARTRKVVLARDAVRQVVALHCSASSRRAVSRWADGADCAQRNPSRCTSRCKGATLSMIACCEAPWPVFGSKPKATLCSVAQIARHLPAATQCQAAYSLIDHARGSISPTHIHLPIDRLTGRLLGDAAGQGQQDLRLLLALRGAVRRVSAAADAPGLGRHQTAGQRGAQGQSLGRGGRQLHDRVLGVVG